MAKTPRRLSKTITIEDPTATEDIDFFYTSRALIITAVQVSVLGGTAVTWSLRTGTVRGTPVANNVLNEASSTGTSAATVAAAAVGATSYAWLTTTVSDSTSLSITVFYTED